jgi:phosphate:Na+ symporter
MEGRPRYLDKTVTVSPELALNALALELSRIAAVARRMSLEALSTESAQGKRIASDHAVADRLAQAVAVFIARLERGSLSAEVSTQLARVLRAEQHLLACADQAMEVARAQPRLGVVSDEVLQNGLSRFRMEVASLMTLTNMDVDGFSFAACEEQLQRMQVAYDDVKELLLQAGAGLRVPVPMMNDVLEQNSAIRRMARQMFKATQYLNELNTVANVQLPDNAERVPHHEEDEPLAEL